MKKSVNKRSLIVCVLSIVLCLSLLVGFSYAWFTDSVASGRNVITAGNLDVELAYRATDGSYIDVDADTELFDDDTLWEPGHTEVVYLRVRNAGTLALRYNLAVNVTSEIGAVNVAGDNFKLSDYVLFGQDRSDDEIAAYDNREAAIVAAATARPLGAYTDEDVLLSNEDVYIALIAYMPTTTGNEANYRGTPPAISLGVSLRATQTPFEADSFDNTYDAGAPLTEAPFADSVDVLYPVRAAATITDVAQATTVVAVVSGAPVAQAVIPADALGEEAANSQAVLTITPLTETPANFTVENGQAAIPYDIDLSIGGEAYQAAAPVDIEMFIGTGLDSVKVYHGDPGVLVASTYDPATGIARFSTASFSPWTFVYNVPVAAANIGDTYYYSLADALAAAADGDTVYLGAGEFDLAAVTIKRNNLKILGATDANGAPASKVTTTGAIVLHGNNNSISNVAFVAKHNGFLIDNVNQNSGAKSLNLRIANCIITGTGTNCNGIRLCGSATITGCDFIGGFRQIGWSYGYDTVLIEDCTFMSGTYSINFDGGSGDVIVRNCEIAGWNSYSYTLNSFTFEDTTFKNGYYNVLRPYTNTTLNRCHFESNFALNPAGTKEMAINVNDCTYDGESIVDSFDTGNSSTASYYVDGVLQEVE